VREQTVAVSVDHDVQQITDDARAAGRIGLDTEFLREKTYHARLCLVQIAAAERISLIDPLAGADLRPVADVVANPEVEIVVHAGRQDFEILLSRFDVVPRNVFDVQLAAGFTGLSSSLAYHRLVEETIGTKVSKGEAYTEWCRRPLTDLQLTYAADDVRYLLPIADYLKRRLAELGRGEWVKEEMKAFETRAMYETAPENAWRRVAGRGTLNARATAVLKEIAAWREEAARTRNVPRGWVVRDPTLVEIARRRPASASQLKGIRGLASQEAGRSAGGIIDAVKRGLKTEPIAAPQSPSRSALARAQIVSSVADAVVRARCASAEIASELVATRAELEAVLIDLFDGSSNTSRHRLLQGWRRELAGDAVLALVRGEIAVRIADRPPYVEEVAP
jgi:ribonuclease D